MPDRELADAIPGEAPTHEQVQQLIEAERGLGTQGVLRTWQASNSSKVVLISDADGVRISADDGTTTPSAVLVASMLDTLLPPGTIWAYGASGAPAGWLVCDGASVSTTTYAKLFAAIGYTYGGGGGVFSLPDLRGRVVLGVSGTHPRGQTGGAETAPGPLHAHNVNVDHNHPTLQTLIPDQVGTLATPSATGTLSVSRDTHTHGGSVPHLGATVRTTETTDYAGVTVPTLPPFAVATYIIRTGS